MYIYKLAKFIPFIALWSCLQSSPPGSAPVAPESTATKENQVYTNAIKTVKYVDARSIYTLKVTDLIGSSDKVTFRFKGKQMPTLTIYKNEIQKGSTFKLISPSYKLRDLVIESSNKNKIIGKQIIRLQKSKPNQITI